MRGSVAVPSVKQYFILTLWPQINLPTRTRTRSVQRHQGYRAVMGGYRAMVEWPLLGKNWGKSDTNLLHCQFSHHEFHTKSSRDWTLVSALRSQRLNHSQPASIRRMVRSVPPQPSPEVPRAPRITWSDCQSFTASCNVSEHFLAFNIWMAQGIPA